MGKALFQILIFPGFLFLSVASLLFEYIDRKLHAKLQNRIGPPWYQPLADIIKLFSKETVVPREADKRIFKWIPLFALAATTCAFLYIPIWGKTSLFPFEGDLIVVLYFLTVPTLTFFLAGWSSTSLYAEIGSIRAMTQLFAYEVPLYLSILGPAMLAGTWSLSGVTAFYAQNPLLALCNIPGFLVSIVAIQGKLERVPFDIPDAETEIVGGTFTEYSGRLLGMFRMTLDSELVVVSGLIAAVFLPFFIPENPVLGMLVFLVKVFIVVFILAVMRTALARLRIDQMIAFCWKVLAPVALLQLLIDLIVKGAILA
ncbi:MAG: complex I subunit 1 family protein [Clostridiaceae bacterium]|nr:NADH-quinone oxidoreductase subunit H [Eubacteriales bacterium]